MCKICKNCIGNEILADYITKNGDEKYCNYCKKSIISIDLRKLIPIIEEGILSEYNDAYNDDRPYDSEENRYLFGGEYDVYGILGDEINSKYSDRIIEDLVSIGLDETYYEKYWQCFSLDKDLMYSWSFFSNFVKHKVRYVFSYLPETCNFQDKEINLNSILDIISYNIQKLNLIKTIGNNEIIYRCRVHKDWNNDFNAKSLGTPPIEKAIYSNRLTAAGIPAFYGAFDERTCCKEIISNLSTYSYVTIGEFKPINELKILDLTSIPRISMFDQERKELRYICGFMFNFVAKLNEPITKDNKEHIDYVPTQIFTEYLRFVYSKELKHQIDGIIYPSSKSQNGKNCVLFYDNRMMHDTGCSDKGLILTKKITRPINSIISFLI